MFLSDVSIKRPVFATMMMVALLVLGVVSYKRLAIDEYPDVTYPVVTASTTYPGASPEVMERDVSRPIEEALNTVQGIKEINSTSQEGQSSVRVTFNLGVDVLEAQQDVRGQGGAHPPVAAARHPGPRRDPRFDPNDRPIMSIAVQSTERSIRELTDLAEQVICQPHRVDPGRRRRERDRRHRRARSRCSSIPTRCARTASARRRCRQALARENQEVPAGRIYRGDVEKLVRVTGRIVDPLAFGDIVVATQGQRAGPHARRRAPWWTAPPRRARRRTCNDTRVGLGGGAQDLGDATRWRWPTRCAP